MGRKYAGQFRMNQGVDEVWQTLPAALAECGFDVKASSDDERSLSAKKNMKNVTTKNLGRRGAKATWGEKLEASVTEDGDVTWLSLESRLVFGLIDWGENQRNVVNVHAELVRQLT